MSTQLLQGSVTLGKGKGKATAPLTFYLSKQGNPTLVLAPKQDGTVPPDGVGRYFRGFGLPALAEQLPTVATVQVEAPGEDAVTLKLELEQGSTERGNVRRRGQGMVSIGDDQYRATVQVSETRSGWWVIATVIPSSGGAPTVSAEANPFG